MVPNLEFFNVLNNIESIYNISVRHFFSQSFERLITKPVGREFNQVTSCVSGQLHEIPGYEFVVEPGCPSHREFSLDHFPADFLSVMNRNVEDIVGKCKALYAMNFDQALNFIRHMFRVSQPKLA